MNKNSFQPYRTNSQILYQQNLHHQNRQFNLYSSPFRKNLPIIYETESSPYKQFKQLNVENTKQEYESRLVEDQTNSEQSTGFSTPDQTRLINILQKQFITKIQQKQKQLVILQHRIYMLRNSNQCLRQTISQDRNQKEQLYKQIYDLTKENNEIKQREKKLGQISQGLHQTKSQQQRFFQENNINSQTKQSLTSQNSQLKKQIQSLKQYYQEQIYQIFSRNQSSFAGLQVDIEFKEKQRQQLQAKVTELYVQLQRSKNQKKQFLKQYLQIIDQLKKQTQSLRIQASNAQIKGQNVVKQNMCEEGGLRFKQNSYPFINLIQSANFETSINSNKLMNNEKGNQQLLAMIKKAIKDQTIQDQNNFLSQQIQKSASTSSLNPYQSLDVSFNNNNTSYLSYKLNDRTMPITYMVSPQKLMQITSKASLNRSYRKRMSPNPLISYDFKVQSSKRNLYNQRHNQIDRKLQQIKQQLTKELVR